MSRIYDIGAEAQHPPTFTDMLGQEVRIGDTVAYAIRVANSGALKVGTVTELWWVEGAGWDYRIVATFQSGSNDRARVLTGRKPSQPSRGRMVRVAKGGNW
jgi:hypothetical protein